jgi:hypothetical protein
MLCDLSWSGWHGCDVILHVKPLDLGHVQAHIIIVYFDDWVSLALLCGDDVVSSRIMSWDD